MNKHIKTLTSSLLAVAIIGTTGLVMAEENSIGAKAAAEDKSYTLSEMLTYAIQDEYLAKAEYAVIIDHFDVTRPFTNIIKAEANHIAELLPLFKAYKVPVTAESEAAGHTAIPATLTETFAVGVEAEKSNIAMYETFLKQDIPDDVREVFENLRDGSIKHQAAFERGLNGDGIGDGAGFRSGNTAGRRGRISTETVTGNSNGNSAVQVRGNRGRGFGRG